MNDGGPAFPQATWEKCDANNNVSYPEFGMTLRDYFAAKAMAGWLSTYGDARHPVEAGYAHKVASEAYGLADAMLVERQKGVAE